MMLLCWCVLLLLLGLSASTEDTDIVREVGMSVTLKCSKAKCNLNNFIGTYLFHDLKKREEVLYYHPGPPQYITPRKRYLRRTETKGSADNHNITISNLTVNDSGTYSCVYLVDISSEVTCNVYRLFVLGVATGCREEEEPDAFIDYKEKPFLVSTVLCTCAFSMLAIMITLLLIIRVKKWINNRQATNVQKASGDFVYEVMGKNGFHREEAPEDSLPNPYGLD